MFLKKLILNVHFGLVLFVAVFRSTANDGDDSFKLPKNLRPENYNLEIYTDLESGNFNYWGTVCIEVTCVENTNRIVLNSREITIVEADVTVISVTDSNVKIVVTGHKYVELNDIYEITIDQNLLVDNSYVVCIPFTSTLRDDMRGYYRSSYVDAEGNTKWLSITQFEPVDARAAFPCFDEVGMKATFAITLAHAQGLIALSNMPVHATYEKYDEGTQRTWVLDEFEKSVKMSTYLVAMSINDFQSEQTVEPKSQVTVGVWARPNAIDQVAFAKQIAVGALDYYIQYFVIPYAICKLDLMAAPDFSNAGMENYGLITFREIVLLIQLERAGFIFKYSIVKVICHEICHQWMGNLVTMEWWDALWLNEGLATYFQSKCTDKLQPESHFLDYEVITTFIAILKGDAQENAHAVSVPITDPSIIDQIFDETTYYKGSFLIRMISLLLSEEVFQKGLRKYLNKYQFGNAKSDDLWYELTEVANEAAILINGLDIKTIMDPLLLQPGSPLLTVTRDYTRRTVTVAQTRFYNSMEHSNNKFCWILPLTFTSSTELNFKDIIPKYWLNCDGPLTFDVNIGGNDWLMFNLQLMVPAVIKYDDTNLKLIGQTMADKNALTNIDVLSRFHLMSDLTALIKARLIDFNIAFDLFLYLANEYEFQPWKKVIPIFGGYRLFFLGTEILEPFENYFRSLITPKFKEFGNINESVENMGFLNLKLLVVNWSCVLKVENCQQQCKDLFDMWFTSSNQDNPILDDFRQVVYCNAIRLGGPNEWNFLWTQYQNTNIPSEIQIILSSLVCSQDTENLKTFLDWSIDSKKIRPQDSLSVVQGMLQLNDNGFAIVKDFFINRFQDIYKTHRGNPIIVGKYVELIFTAITRRKDLDDLINFTDSVQNQLQGVSMILERNKKAATDNVIWFEQSEATFLNVFHRYGK